MNFKTNSVFRIIHSFSPKLEVLDRLFVRRVDFLEEMNI